MIDEFSLKQLRKDLSLIKGVLIIQMLLIFKYWLLENFDLILFNHDLHQGKYSRIRMFQTNCKVSHEVRCSVCGYTSSIGTSIWRKSFKSILGIDVHVISILSEPYFVKLSFQRLFLYILKKVYVSRIYIQSHYLGKVIVSFRFDEFLKILDYI